VAVGVDQHRVRMPQLMHHRSHGYVEDVMNLRSLAN
jgi:hypothetical protein